jgi:hypothetical protein
MFTACKKDITESGQGMTANVIVVEPVIVVLAQTLAVNQSLL